MHQPNIGTIHLFVLLLPTGWLVWTSSPCRIRLQQCSKCNNRNISVLHKQKNYPNITVHPEWDLSSAKARDFVVNLDKLHEELQLQIAKAQKHYQGPADDRHWHWTYKIGDLVFVKAAHFRTNWPSKKLSEKNLGPYKIIAQVRKAYFTLWLPNHLPTVHSIFHVSQLEPTTPNTIPNRVQSPPPPTEVDKDIEYEISEILDSKLDKWRKCQLLYLIQ